MTDTAVTSRSLTLTSNVAQSAALDSTSTAGTSVATGNTAVFTPAGGGNTRMTVFSFYGSADSTVTFVDGDEPPSESSGLTAASALTISNGKAYVVVLGAGQYVQSDGTVRATIGGTGPVICNSFNLPLGQ